jgi:hypothetical protein
MEFGFDEKLDAFKPSSLRRQDSGAEFSAQAGLAFSFGND